MHSQENRQRSFVSRVIINKRVTFNESKDWKTDWRMWKGLSYASVVKKYDFSTRTCVQVHDKIACGKIPTT